MREACREQVLRTSPELRSPWFFLSNLQNRSTLVHLSIDGGLLP